ncbi:MAG: hypothetical protein P9L96_03195 [Candidatus Gygaella obscura]|nr:hypothetical protein [Candidatus Gygaella obscura]
MKLKEIRFLSLCLNVLRHGLLFLKLLVAVFLPYKIRCFYSEWLMKLEFGFKIDKKNGIIAGEKFDRRREYDIFVSRGIAYYNDGCVEKALKSFNKALELSFNKKSAFYVYSLLQEIYSKNDITDLYFETILSAYKSKKDLINKEEVL